LHLRAIVGDIARRSPGFGELLDRIEGNGVRIVIVEDASRFARDLITQELGILALIKRGVRVLTANGDDLTDDSDPARKMMRQVAIVLAPMLGDQAGRRPMREALDAEPAASLTWSNQLGRTHRSRACELS
jgi:DNA invertase Pin-like site-specific DNA recombinase